MAKIIAWILSVLPTPIADRLRVWKRTAGGPVLAVGGGLWTLYGILQFIRDSLLPWLVSKGALQQPTLTRWEERFAFIPALSLTTWVIVALVLLVIAVLEGSYRVVRKMESESVLPLAVNIHTARCAGYVVTLNLQVINKSHYDAVWLTFRVGLKGSRESWPQVGMRGIEEIEEVVVHLGGPYGLRDAGMETRMPDRAKLAPQADVEGWITFERPNRHDYGYTFTITEENVKQLILRVSDDASGRVLEVPIWA